MNPRKRRDSIVVTEVQDETVVYDLTRHKAHCLNPTAALIWNHCDGKTAVPDIARKVGDSLGATIGAEVVWRALGQLGKVHLMEEPVAVPARVKGLSRRDLLRKGSLAAALLPIVISLGVPTAAIASHTCNPGTCIASSACRPTVDLCKCCGPPACDKRCDAGGRCSNAVAGC